jgi:N,N'-diacetyllegionaminate synthase
MTVEIIAEVAQGYEGNSKLSELLTLGAIRSGADAVKYQIIYADELSVPSYQYYDLFKSLEMDISVWRDVVELVSASQKKILFDVYGEKSLSLAKELGASGVKISTTDFANKPLIKQALNTFEKVYISIGGIPISEVDNLVNRLKNKDQITLMYGFQAEPTPLEENNLLRITSLKKRYPDIATGFMDHSAGNSQEAYYLPLMATSLGVNVIEKHITLDPLLEIEDYVSALEPSKFKEFVSIIRTMEKALGKSGFELTAKEHEYRNKAGKVVVAKQDLEVGNVLKESDLILKRVNQEPALIYYYETEKVLGKSLKSNIFADSPITDNLT